MKAVIKWSEGKWFIAIGRNVCVELYEVEDIEMDGHTGFKLYEKFLEKEIYKIKKELEGCRHEKHEN